LSKLAETELDSSGAAGSDTDHLTSKTGHLQMVIRASLPAFWDSLDDVAIIVPPKAIWLSKKEWCLEQQ
jgi:hypothetical protein